jgi:hypothetical protein
MRLDRIHPGDVVDREIDEGSLPRERMMTRGRHEGSASAGSLFVP